MNQINKILVAVDFSDVSVKALQLAVEVSEKLGSELEVVHAVPMSAVKLPQNGVEQFNDEMIKDSLNEAMKKMEEFVGEHVSDSARLTLKPLFGEPTSEINIYAEANNFDLLVMGTHGRTGISHLLMGSVAESVLRNAKIPVLCAPSK